MTLPTVFRCFPESIVVGGALAKSIIGPDRVGLGLFPVDGIADHAEQCRAKAIELRYQPEVFRNVYCHGFGLVMRWKQYADLVGVLYTENGYHPSARDFLASQMRVFDQACFMEGVRDYTLYIDWKENAWGPTATKPYTVAEKDYATITRDIFKRAGMWRKGVTIIDPYACRPGAFPVTDYDGNPQPVNTSIDYAGTSCTWSGLVVGNEARRLFPNDPRRQKFCALIAEQNARRSRAAKGPLAMGIAIQYGLAQGFSEEFTRWGMEQDVAHGCRLTPDQWHVYPEGPGDKVAAEDHIAGAFAMHHRHRPAVSLRLPTIPLDSQRFTTGNFTSDIGDMPA